jgi:hypothetical protein
LAASGDLHGRFFSRARALLPVLRPRTHQISMAKAFVQSASECVGSEI